MSTPTDKTLCVIVPFRDRYEDLSIFSPNLSKFSNYQNITYRIVVVNQLLNAQFNRGKLLNIGFLEYENTCDYFIFHDVDIYPKITDLLKNAKSDEDFGWQKVPNYKYHSGAWSIAKPGKRSAGTIFKISKDLYREANGHTNCLWGWGYEDNDLYYRLTSGLGVSVAEQGKRASKYGSHNFGFTRPNTGWVSGHQINKEIVPKMWGYNLKDNMQLDGLNSCCYRVDSEDVNTEYNYTMLNVYV